MNDKQQGLEAQFEAWGAGTVSRNPALRGNYASMFLGNDGTEIALINSEIRRLKRKTCKIINSEYATSGGEVPFVYGELTSDGIRFMGSERVFVLKSREQLTTDTVRSYTPRPRLGW